MKKESSFYSWTRLDQVALDIEFLLISVVQGVALATLAGASVKPLSMMEWQYLPYVATAFLLVLIFWSGAIIHALSFIDWPLDLPHSFLYFLASFIEVLAFTQLENPIMWFVFILLFQIVAGLLYLYDLRLIRKHKKRFDENSHKRALYLHILSQQEKELNTFVPLAILYSSIAVIGLWFYSSFFIESKYHLIFIVGQLLFSMIFLRNSINSFKRRSFLISQTEKGAEKL